MGFAGVWIDTGPSPSHSLRTCTPVPHCELSPEHPVFSKEVEPSAYQTCLLQRCFIYVVLPWPRQQEPLARFPWPGRGSNPIPILRDWLQHCNPALIQTGSRALPAALLPPSPPSLDTGRKRRSGTKGACSHTWVRAGNCGGGWQ